MAVLEAWSYGLPVLMTPQCNIPEGFLAKAAIRIDPDSGSIEKGLKKFFSLSEEDQLEKGRCGRRLVEEKFTGKSSAEEMVSVYKWVLGGGPPPSCVRLD